MVVFEIKCGSSVGACDGAVMFLETNPVCEAFGGPDDVGGSIGGDVDGGFGFGLVTKTAKKIIADNTRIPAAKIVK